MVEDDPNDALLVKHAFDKLDAPVNLSSATNGDEALSRLDETISDDGDGPP